MISRRDFLLALAALPVVGLPSETEFARLQRLARQHGWQRMPGGAAVGEVAKALVGKPYVGGTLDEDPSREVCVLDLDRYDCVTLYEVALAFVRMIRGGGTSLEDLRREVALLRYRGGKVNGYLSRLHYTTDWLADNHRRGTVRLLSDLPGSEPLQRKIEFMSRNPNRYKQLQANPTLLPELRKIEERLSAQRLRYVPAAQVAAAEPKLETGDIVGIMTAIDGLDCSHTGLCYRQGIILRFLHASSVRKQVTLDGRLSEYVKSSPRAIGILVARPLG